MITFNIILGNRSIMGGICFREQPDYSDISDGSGSELDLRDSDSLHSDSTPVPSSLSRSSSAARKGLEKDGNKHLHRRLLFASAKPKNQSRLLAGKKGTSVRALAPSVRGNVALLDSLKSKTLRIFAEMGSAKAAAKAEGNENQEQEVPERGEGGRKQREWTAAERSNSVGRKRRGGRGAPRVFWRQKCVPQPRHRLELRYVKKSPKVQPKNSAEALPAKQPQPPDFFGQLDSEVEAEARRSAQFIADLGPKCELVLRHIQKLAQEAFSGILCAEITARVE